MLQALRIFKDVRSFQEIFERITWDMIKKLLVLPMILFIISPLSLLIHTSFQFWYLEQTISSTNMFVMEYAAFVLLLCAFKAASERRSLRTLVRRNPVILFFGCFCVLILISTAANPTAVYAFEGTWRMEYFYSYLIYVCCYFGCTAFINSERAKCILIRMLQVVSMIQVVIVYLDRILIRIEPFHRGQYANTITSVYSNQNFYAYYLTIVILVSAALFLRTEHKGWRIFDGACFLLNAFTLMQSDTLGCFFATLIGLIFLGVMLYIIDHRIEWGVAMLIAVYLFVFALDWMMNDTLFASMITMVFDMQRIAFNDADAGSAGSGRWSLWVHTVQYISERPLLGWGAEGIFDRLNDEAYNSRPHNEILQYAAFFGIPAALCYFAGVFSVFLHGLRHKNELDAYTIAALAGAFGYLVSSCFGNTVYSIAPFFFCILGLAVRPCRKPAK